jgi:SRSO17 transposase
VRRRVARWAAAHIAPQAYAIDDTGFPKDGYDSPGVARMYCGALGACALITVRVECGSRRVTVGGLVVV